MITMMQWKKAAQRVIRSSCAYLLTTGLIVYLLSCERSQSPPRSRDPVTNSVLTQEDRHQCKNEEGAGNSNFRGLSAHLSRLASTRIGVSICNHTSDDVVIFSDPGFGLHGIFECNRGGDAESVTTFTMAMDMPPVFVVLKPGSMNSVTFNLDLEDTIAFDEIVSGFVWIRWCKSSSLFKPGSADDLIARGIMTRVRVSFETAKRSGDAIHDRK